MHSNVSTHPRVGLAVEAASHSRQASDTRAIKPAAIGIDCSDSGICLLSRGLSQFSTNPQAFQARYAEVILHISGYAEKVAHSNCWPAKPEALSETRDEFEHHG